MKAVYEAYRDEAIILVVYIREAHPAAQEQTEEDAGWKVIDGTVFHQPKTFAERRKLAETACTFWDMPMPVLVDTMEPNIGATYQAWPNRLYLIDVNGRIVFHGPKGPRGVDIHQGEIELRKLLGKTDELLVTKPIQRSTGTSGRGRLSRGARSRDAASTPPETPSPTGGQPSE